MAKYILVHGIRVCNDFTPETFNRLTSIGPKFRLGKDNFQVFECSCGNTVVRYESDPKRGRTKSCGCFQKEALTRNNKEIAKHKFHGMSGTPEYKVLKSMQARCFYPKDICYKDYGGRGITVCDRWREPNGQGFINFLADMGKRPSSKHSIDRIDVNGNYEPSNCRWATTKEQGRNRRTNKILTYNGVSQCVAAWAEALGVTDDLITGRIKNGWSTERALTEPINCL